MDSQTTITVKVRDSKSYKGRQDVEINSWFRCSNRLLEDPFFFDFSHEEINVWLYIMSQCSQHNTGTVRIVFSHADRVSRLSRSAIVSAIEKLRMPYNGKASLLEPEDVSGAVRGRNGDGTPTCATGQDTTDRTDTTAASLEPPQPPEIFEPKTCGEVLEALPSSTLDSWAQLYPDPEFRQRTALIAWEFYSRPKNSKKRPRTIDSWAQALGYFYKSDWPKHIKAADPPKNSRRASASAYEPCSPPDPQEPRSPTIPADARAALQNIQEKCDYKAALERESKTRKARTEAFLREVL